MGTGLRPLWHLKEGLVQVCPNNFFATLTGRPDSSALCCTHWPHWNGQTPFGEQRQPQPGHHSRTHAPAHHCQRGAHGHRPGPAGEGSLTDLHDQGGQLSPLLWRASPSWGKAGQAGGTVSLWQEGQPPPVLQQAPAVSSSLPPCDGLPFSSERIYPSPRCSQVRKGGCGRVAVGT